MAVEYEERASDSPFVERVWRTQSDRSGSFTSIASCHWEMVARRGEGKATFIVRGPETKVTPLDFPDGPEWLGITFKVGAFLPHLRPGHVIDLRDATLPAATTQRFWLHDSAWQFPNFENADTFVAQLWRGGSHLCAQTPSLTHKFVHLTGRAQMGAVAQQSLSGLVSCLRRHAQRACQSHWAIRA